MQDIFLRTEMIIGHEAITRLRGSKVIVFGVGGVGTYVIEALTRSGIGRFVLVDHDVICETNINRQLHALQSTVGLPKVIVMKNRMQEINPEVSVTAIQEFATLENIRDMIEGDADYVIDAIDTVTAKIAIIMYCKEQSIPIISSMGTGNKLYPEKLELADIYETSVCPLAKVMRKELRKRGVTSLTVCYSREEPISPIMNDVNSSKRQTPGSIAFVPAAAGLLIAGKAVRGIMSRA